MNILLIPGSLRKDSLNMKLAENVSRIANELRLESKILDISEIPLFNSDLENNLPKSIIDFYKNLEWAEGFILISPEYNRSYSGVIKNVLDWASRAKHFRHKKVSIMGASDGYFGTRSAQVHLKTLMVELEMDVISKPEVLVAKAQDKFNTDGILIDEYTINHIKEQLNKF